MSNHGPILLRLIAAAAAALGLGLCPGYADTNAVPSETSWSSETGTVVVAESDAGTGAVPVVATADLLKYDRKSGWAEGVGHVVVTHGEDELRADYLRLNANTRRGHAQGNVHLAWEKSQWTGDAIHFDLVAQTASFSNLWCYYPPLRLWGSQAERDTNGVTRFTDVVATTCTNDHGEWHFHTKARELSVYPDDSFEAHRVIWYFGGVPVLYLPYFGVQTQEESGFRFRLGHDSRLGGYLLGSYRYSLPARLAGRTHVDYRAKRGFGFGQELLWSTPQEEGRGDILFYHARDWAPDTGREDETDEGGTVPGNRHRIRLRHDHDFTERDYLLLNGDYLSDAELREDFFEYEYRASRDPDNHAVLTHRGERYTAYGMVRARLNDFYTSVNRSPELSLDVSREEIGLTGFEYEGETTVAYLQRLWAASETNEQDYSAFRADSLHTVYRPARFFGFLNVIPRAGYRGTYYSKTREQVPVVVTNMVRDATQPSNAPPVAVIDTNMVDQAAPADYRSVYELGLEVSFKAFRTWKGRHRPYRHVVEPYANYTFVPPPDLPRERLYQFDGIDRIREEHTILLGTRNKLQTKRKKRASDIIDADLYTVYNVEPRHNEEPFEAIYLDLQAEPCRWAVFEIESAYNIEESALDEFNSRVILSWDEWLEADVEHRLRPDDSSLLSGELVLFPDRSWTFEIYSRYEFEESRLEEQTAYLQKTFDCMAFRIGGGFIPGELQDDGSIGEDEWRATVELWLTAFPESGLRVAGDRM